MHFNITGKTEQMCAHNFFGYVLSAIPLAPAVLNQNHCHGACHDLQMDSKIGVWSHWMLVSPESPSSDRKLFVTCTVLKYYLSLQNNLLHFTSKITNYSEMFHFLLELYITEDVFLLSL